MRKLEKPFVNIHLNGKEKNNIIHFPSLNLKEIQLVLKILNDEDKHENFQESLL